MKKTTLSILLGLAVWQLSAQLSFTSQTINTTGTYDLCVVDMNGDYLDDIVSVSLTNINIHYQEEDGTFNEENFTTSSANYMPSWSLAAGDITGNGYNDLLYGGGNGVTFMIADDNGESYTEISGPEYVFSQRSNFVDINNDGHLDAFVCHDVAPNVYYINDGEGNLTFQQGGIGDYPTGGHYGSLWVDYNNDGNIDMFIAKCGGEEERRTNQLFHNNGDGTFTDVAEDAGLDDLIQTWSAAWGDFDNDGHMDALVGASSNADGLHKLMQNNGDGTFSNITNGSGWDTFTGTSYEHATYDFNNDGYLDIFGNTNKVFINNGDMTFTAVNVPFSGAAIGDLNNDGFLDAFVNGNIYFNDTNQNNWIKITTEGVESNRNGIGARVEVHSALGVQIRDIRSGEGFAFMSSLNTHFGIGTDTEIEKIVVKWPSGTVDTIEDPDINTVQHVVEGEYELGTQNAFATSLVLYPNPALQTVTISSPDNLEGASVQIYDISGRVVQKGSLTENSIDVGTLQPGSYFLKIKANGKTATKQFLKK